MTTNYHTAIAYGADATSANLNAPLSELDSSITSIYFTYSGNATEFLNGEGNFAVPAGTGASIDGHVIQGEGTPLTQRANLNFVGADVEVTNEVAGTQVAINAPNDNLLINGDLQVWQDGTSQVMAAINKFPDMCYVAPGGAVPTGTISQQKFTNGQTDVPGNPENYLRLTTTDMTSVTFVDFTMKIEDVRTCAGEDVTFSYYAKADAPIAVIAPRVEQDFGSGGSVGTSASFSIVSFSTAWQKFTETITIPSVAGKTIGAGSNLAFIIRIATTSTFVVDIARVKVEPGSVATESPIEPEGDVLRKCERYYETSYDYGIAPGTATSNGMHYCLVPSNTLAAYQGYDTIRLAVKKRAVPTLSFYSAAGTLSSASNATPADIGANSVTVTLQSDNSFFARNGPNVQTTIAQAVFFQWVADSRL